MLIWDDSEFYSNLRRGDLLLAQLLKDKDGFWKVVDHRAIPPIFYAESYATMRCAKTAFEEKL